MQASCALGAHALRLYMYLAANADNYTLYLSPSDIEASIGMARSTYHDQFRKLENLGYIVSEGNNYYHFYERPNYIYNAPRTNDEVGSGDTTQIEVAAPGISF